MHLPLNAMIYSVYVDLSEIIPENVLAQFKVEIENRKIMMKEKKPRKKKPVKFVKSELKFDLCDHPALKSIK